MNKLMKLLAKNLPTMDETAIADLLTLIEKFSTTSKTLVAATDEVTLQHCWCAFFFFYPTNNVQLWRL